MNAKAVSGGMRPSFVGLGFRRQPAVSPVVLDGGVVWRSGKVAGLVLETTETDGHREYALRLEDVVVRAWKRSSGWPSQFRLHKKWKNDLYDPKVRIGNDSWRYELDPEAAETAIISIGSDRWVLKRVRLLKFRLTRQGKDDEVFFGPNLGARGLHSGTPETVSLACMLQLLHVEVGFSRSVPIAFLAVLRRFFSFYAA